MLQSLVSAVVETMLGFLWEAGIKFLGLENVVEFVTALVGLACIVIGFFVWWSGP